MHEESMRILSILGTKGLGLQKRRRYPRLEIFVKNFFEHSSDLETARQVVASLGACYSICQIAGKGKIPLGLVGDHYLPTTKVFAGIWDDNKLKETRNNQIQAKRVQAGRFRPSVRSRGDQVVVLDHDMEDAPTVTPQHSQELERELTPEEAVKQIVERYKRYRDESYDTSRSTDAHARLESCLRKNFDQEKVKWLLDYLVHCKADDLPASWTLPGLSSEGLDVLWELSHKSRTGKSPVQDPDFDTFKRWLSGKVSRHPRVVDVENSDRGVIPF